MSLCGRRFFSIKREKIIEIPSKRFFLPYLDIKKRVQITITVTFESL